MRLLKGPGTKGWTVALLAAALCIAGTASAIVIQGKGELAAAGHGVAVVTMRGGATIAGGGLAVVPERKIVELEGQGRVTPLDGGRVLLEGFGRVVLASPRERMHFEAAGAHLRLRARGGGVAFLKGVGRVWTRDRDAAWDDELTLEFEEE